MWGKVVEGVSGFFKGREETKQVKAQVQLRLAELRQAGELKDKEWELVAKNMEGTTYKDDVVTYWMLALMSAILLVPESWDLVHVDRFKTLISDPTDPLAHLFYIVIGSAVGIRWKNGGR